VQAEGERRDIATELRDVGQVLRGQWWLILICVVLSLGAGYLWSHRADETYESQARVLLLQPNANIALAGNQPFVDPTRERATDLELVRQPVIATRVARDLKLKTAPGQLASKVQASANGDSNVMTIAARDTNPKKTAPLANAFADKFVQFRRETERKRYKKALAAVRSQIADLRGKGKHAKPPRPGTQAATDLRTLRFQARQLSLLSSVQTGGSQVIQRAKGHGQKVGPSETRNMVVAGILGLLIGLALAFVRDRLDPRLKTEAALREAAPGIPILATIPRPGRRHGWVAAEGFYTLRSAVDSVNGNNGHVKSLLVTGSMAGEGKSTTTMNLAAAMSGGGRGVTVVEADLRRPGLSRSLGVNGDGPGVSTVLSGEHDVAAALGHATVKPDPTRRGPAWLVKGEFEFMPAGPRPDTPAAILNDEALGRLLDQTTARGDTVIVDGPPLGMFGDMLPVARRVEGVILAVRLHHTKRGALDRLLNRLTTAGIRPMGIVALDAGTNTSEYGHYGRG
jgi:succinoglycan biosynthesis transport protein ExoP